MALDGTTDTRLWNTGDSAAAEWVVVDAPDWGPGEPSPWQQAQAKGVARIVRGEGTWYGNDVIYVISTSGGPAGQGQVFAYDPAAATFTCVFASPSSDVLNAPDNVTVSPRGGLVLCEDGSGREFLHGLTPDGEIFKFAENNAVLPAEYQALKGYAGDFTGSEWAGATFEPMNGNWLFVNLQSPGVTFAITGPWRQGALYGPARRGCRRATRRHRDLRRSRRTVADAVTRRSRAVGAAVIGRRYRAPREHRSTGDVRCAFVGPGAPGPVLPSRLLRKRWLSLVIAGSVVLLGSGLEMSSSPTLPMRLIRFRRSEHRTSAIAHGLGLAVSCSSPGSASKTAASSIGSPD
jgi:Bacterial protein of unknown function (DUF839)